MGVRDAMIKPGDRSIWDRVQRHPWKYRKREYKPRMILLHATRGAQRYNSVQEFEAMLNWQISPDNIIRGDGETYASMANVCIGGGGLLMEIVPDGFYPAYSAGHMDPIAKSYEICQSNDGMPYDLRDIDRLVEEVAEDCVQFGIPPRELIFVSGDNREAPGIARHDRSANGKKYGKSDPGSMFPSLTFYERVARRVEQLFRGEEPMTVEERRRLEHVERQLEQTRWSYLTFAIQKNKQIAALQAHDKHPPGEVK